MEKRWCNACGQAFEPRPQSPRQAYCPKPECQRARKRLWQQTRRKTDPGYYETQAKSQEHWRRQHSDYWRRYREDHPDYAASNRERQKERNDRQRHGARLIANSDTSDDELPPSGVFKLMDLQASPSGIHREWLVRLTVIQTPQSR